MPAAIAVRHRTMDIPALQPWGVPMSRDVTPCPRPKSCPQASAESNSNEEQLTAVAADWETGRGIESHKESEAECSSSQPKSGPTWQDKLPELAGGRLRTAASQPVGRRSNVASKPTVQSDVEATLARAGSFVPEGRQALSPVRPTTADPCRLLARWTQRSLNSHEFRSLYLDRVQDVADGNALAAASRPPLLSLISPPARELNQVVNPSQVEEGDGMELKTTSSCHSPLCSKVPPKSPRHVAGRTRVNLSIDIGSPSNWPVPELDHEPEWGPPSVPSQEELGPDSGGEPRQTPRPWRRPKTAEAFSAPSSLVHTPHRTPRMPVAIDPLHGPWSNAPVPLRHELSLRSDIKLGVPIPSPSPRAPPLLTPTGSFRLDRRQQHRRPKPQGSRPKMPPLQLELVNGAGEQDRLSVLQPSPRLRKAVTPKSGPLGDSKRFHRSPSFGSGWPTEANSTLPTPTKCQDTGAKMLSRIRIEEMRAPVHSPAVQNPPGLANSTPKSSRVATLFSALRSPRSPMFVSTPSEKGKTAADARSRDESPPFQRGSLFKCGSGLSRIF